MCIFFYYTHLKLWQRRRWAQRIQAQRLPSSFPQEPNSKARHVADSGSCRQRSDMTRSSEANYLQRLRYYRPTRPKSDLRLQLLPIQRRSEKKGFIFKCYYYETPL